MPGKHKIVVLRHQPEDLKTVIRQTMEARVPVVLFGNAFLALELEVGDTTKAVDWLVDIATEFQRPIGVKDVTKAVFLAPRDWSKNRAQGWIAANHEILEAGIGPIEKVETCL